MRTSHMGKQLRTPRDRAKALRRPSTPPPLGLPASLERRRSFRVDVPAYALIWRRGSFAGRYHLQDLSIGGCRLVDGPTQRPGDKVEVFIKIPHHGGLCLTATVARLISSSRGQDALALRFETLTATAEDWIHDVVLWTLEGARADCARTALVLVDEPSTTASLMYMLRAMGRPAIHARTPLDAVQLMVERGDGVDVVIIDAQLGGGRGLELAEFLRHNHPSVHRVLLGTREHQDIIVDAHNCGTAEGILSAHPSARELERLLLRLGCWMPLADRTDGTLAPS